MTQLWLGWSLGKKCKGGLRRFAKMEKYFFYHTSSSRNVHHTLPISKNSIESVKKS